MVTFSNCLTSHRIWNSWLFKAHMNDLFIIKTRIVELNKWSYGPPPPPIMLTIEPRKVIICWAILQSLSNIRLFSCPFLESHPTTHNSILNPYPPSPRLYHEVEKGVTWNKGKWAKIILPLVIPNSEGGTNMWSTHYLAKSQSFDSSNFYWVTLNWWYMLIYSRFQEN